MTSKERAKFRTKKEWRNFRKYLLDKYNNECFLCGGKYSGKQKRKLQIHHLDPKNYTNLNENKFVILCSSDHDLIERISKKIMANKSNIKYKKQWYDLLKNALPYEAKIKLERLVFEEANGK